MKNRKDEFMEYRVGVDIGGTNLDIGLVDSEYHIIDKQSVRTAEAKEPGSMAGYIGSAVCHMLKRCSIPAGRIRTIGVGVPGTANIEKGSVEYANNLGFQDVPFVKMIQKDLPGELRGKVLIENDANAAAIGEYLAGGYHVNHFVMMTIGTGIGGGIIMNGKLIRGINGAAGEFGHMSIELSGVTCNCGRRGCFEKYASAPALAEQMRAALREESVDGRLVMKLCGGKRDRIDARIVLEAVRRGDPAAVKVFHQYLFYLSEGIANIINILQPDVLVLSGGIMRSGDLFLEELKEMTHEKIYSRDSAVNTWIGLADACEDPGDTGIIGAACIGLL
ncbi:ROK family protein [Porcincola sp. LCP21S3_C12]|uniref:ROK family protein n=1 Tax=Porcincola sp. LCP21S3_C12 TaxID=3438798 RepID=UPI003F9D9A81